MVPDALKREVEALNKRGLRLLIWEHEGQPYVHVPTVPAPSPPWNLSAYGILIAVPLRYDEASLDAFYLELPYQYGAGSHDKVGGAEIELQGRKWKLASWHYLDGKPWTRGKDSLETHIEHCKGFFLARGVKG